jgi:hypothetical protein
MIPQKSWFKEFDVLVDVEFATKRADGNYYIKGSKKHLAFLDANSKNGMKGGLVKSDKKTQAAAKNGMKGGRPQKSGLGYSREIITFEDSESQSSNQIKQQKNPSETEAKPTEANRNEASISISNSFSNSSSNSDSKKISVLSEHSKKAQLFVGTYCQLFKARHGSNPKILGKDSGIAGRLAKQLSEDDIKKLLTAFFSMPDAWLFKARHPIAAFEMKLNEIVVFANSGNFTTKTQANQADAFATNAVLLDQVRRGEA